VDRQAIDAIYTGGMLEPFGDVSLHELERVRLIIERTEQSELDRDRALECLRAGVEQVRLLSGPLPSRDELHDRL
jgi:predicted DNA-binding antitoxin AbrB/MazE fold protein